MFKEFKEFAIKGNVIDLAVGIIIGAAFNKVVQSLVNDIIMPPIGMVMGKMDFSSMFINLSGVRYDSLADAKKAGVATINYGLFITTIVDFIIMAFVIFFMIRQINRLKRETAPIAVPETKACPYCLSSIAIKAVRCPQCTSSIES